MSRKPKAEVSLSGPSVAAFSAAMRAMREERGVSVADAAAATRGVSATRLAAVEDGRCEPDFVLIMRLARTLGVKPSEFVHRGEILDPAMPLADDVILAALGRAELHKGGGEPGVLYVTLVEHLGLRKGAVTSRRLRPRLRELVAAGLVGEFRRRGYGLLTLTREGKRRLRDAEPVSLPESPQHRYWREARAAATERVGGFHADVRSALDGAAALLADEDATSDAWYALAVALERACKRVGSATHCLREWAEPGDDAADAPSDERRGRRNYRLWDRAAGESGKTG
ncbi:MAG: helix-turn-helix domain-containing protein [Solirubrobacteraceae bacterium]